MPGPISDELEAMAKMHRADEESELDRLKRWHQGASLSRDAYKRENELLAARVKRIFDLACEARAALERQDTESARDLLARATLAANC